MKLIYIFSILIFFLFIYKKPLYSFVVLFFFSKEYIVFTNLIFKYFDYKNDKNYHIIRVVDCDVGALNNFEIWGKICEVLAFKRLYTLTRKKDLSIHNLFIPCILVLLGIPVRVINFLRFFINSRDSLRNSLISFFYFHYTGVKDLKIEFIGKRVYLNCSSRLNIFKIIKKAKPDAHQTEVFETYKKLKEVSKNFRDFEYKNPKNSIFKLGELQTEEGKKIPKNHWSNEVRFRVNKTSEEVKSIVHPTSNIPKDLEKSQQTSRCILDLIKPGSKNPGTIWTSGNYLFKTLSNHTKIVSKWHIEYLTYTIWGPNTLSHNNDYFEEKNLTYGAILGIDPSEIKDNKDIQDLSLGRYNPILNDDTSDVDVIEEIDKFYEI